MANETGIQGLDRTVHLTSTWLRDIATLMETDDRQVAYHALRGVLFATRDRIPPTEAMDFAAQLPMLVRGLFFEGYQHHDKPLKYRDAEPFLSQVQAEMEVTAFPVADTPDAIRAVFTVISEQTTVGEAENVRDMLPGDVRAMWPEEALAAE
jgi:uncharacterized protein (DUF2267 family)